MNAKSLKKYLIECKKNPQKVQFRKFVRCITSLAKTNRIKGSHHVNSMANGSMINLQPCPNDRKYCKKLEVVDAGSERAVRKARSPEPRITIRRPAKAA